MSRLAGLGAGPVIGVGVVAVAAAVAIGAYFAGRDAPPAPAPAPPQAEAPTDAGDAPSVGTGVVAPVSPAAADTEIAASPEAAPDTQAPAPPALDTFRLDPDGRMLVAGRAVPGGTVAITVDDARLGTAEADGAGKFVAFLDLVPSDRVRVLGLELLLEDGGVIRAPDEILIAPAPPPAPQPEAVTVAEAVAEAEAVAVAEADMRTPVEGDGAEGAESPGTEIRDVPAAGAVKTVETATTETTETTETTARATGEAGTVVAPEPAPEVAATQPAAPELPATVAAPEPDTGVAAAAPPSEPPAAPPATPTVMLSDAGGVRVLQAPGAPGPEVMSSVALDAISYSDAGEVQLSGRADTPDAQVRIYLDNRAVTTVPVDDTGAWRSALPDVDTGIYTLRVDVVGRGGEVTSRIETPFKREDVATLSARDRDAPLGADGHPPPPRMSVVTVQPGSTLWAISREAYGEGILYVRVFEANRDRIRDPDLIYPGQVFELPE